MDCGNFSDFVLGSLIRFGKIFFEQFYFGNRENQFEKKHAVFTKKVHSLIQQIKFLVIGFNTFFKTMFEPSNFGKHGNNFFKKKQQRKK